MEVLVCFCFEIIRIISTHFKLRVDSSPLVFELHSSIGKEEVG